MVSGEWQRSYVNKRSPSKFVAAAPCKMPARALTIFNDLIARVYSSSISLFGVYVLRFTVITFT